MKLISAIVLFSLNLLNRVIAGQSNACVDQPYTTGTDPELEKQLVSEFSTFQHLMRKLPNIFNHKEDPYWMDDKTAKQLCACVYYKKKQKAAKDTNTTVQPFKEIFESVTFRYSTIHPKIKFFFIPIKCQIPGIDCTFGNEKYDVVRGLKKNSGEEAIYNIYVGHTVSRKGGEKVDFDGVIRDVNVKQSNVPKEENS